MSTATPQLTIDIERNGPDATTAIVHCHGRLILETGSVLYTQVSQLLPDAKHIILDLSDLTYADSMGLGTLVRIYVHTKTHGATLELTHLGKRIRELLGVTGLLSVFKIIGEQGIHIKY